MAPVTASSVTTTGSPRRGSQAPLYAEPPEAGNVVEELVEQHVPVAAAGRDEVGAGRQAPQLVGAAESVQASATRVRVLSQAATDRQAGSTTLLSRLRLEA